MREWIIPLIFAVGIVGSSLAAGVAIGDLAPVPSAAQEKTDGRVKTWTECHIGDKFYTLPFGERCDLMGHAI